jgi:AraC family transcriptional regulator, positive regulator of tynA and feaB
VGAARFARVAATPSVYRGRPRLGSDIAPIFVALQTNGDSLLGDGVRQIRLLPGEWTVFDARCPFTISSQHCMELIFVNVPGLIPARPPRQPLIYPTFEPPGTSGSARMFSDLVVSLFRELENVDSNIAISSVDLLRSLFSDAFRIQCPWPARPLETQRRAVMQYIEEHLSDPELSPPSIASALGMSIRQVHRLFKRAGSQTVGEYIWKRRIQRCSEELRSGANAALSVTTIAFRWGFSSSPHFSRAFKEEMGLTASEYRRNFLTDSGNAIQLR